MNKATKELTLSVPEAGRLLGFGRDASYEAARRGDLPTVRFGRLRRVPVVALERLLSEADRAAKPATARSTGRPD